MRPTGWLAGLVMACAATALAQDGVVVRTGPFETRSTTFVDVPGSELRFDGGSGNFVLLLWRASLVGDTSGSAAAELLLSSAPAVRWGQGAASDVPAGRPVEWFNFDWDVGRPIDIRARLRTGEDGGVARLARFEAVALNLGPSGRVRFDEAFAGGQVLVDDSQWTAIATATVPAGVAQPWLAFAQATVEAGAPTGVSLRLRLPTGELPEPKRPGGPRGRFLAGGGGQRSFFLATPLGSPFAQPGDTAVLEATVNPRVFDGGSLGLTASLRDVRLALIPASVLPFGGAQLTNALQQAPPGQSTLVASGGASTMAPGPTAWELLTFSGLATSDGGLVEHEARVEVGPDTSHVAPASLDGEHPTLGGYAFRQLGGSFAPTMRARSPVGALETWTGRFSRWSLTATIVVQVYDAGAGGADGGAPDGGSEDAGAPDGGPLDGGPLDGGPLDGGPLDGGPLDGGELDGGPLDGGDLDGGPLDGGDPADAGRADGGAPVGPPDAGPAEGPGQYQVGCSCHSAPAAGALLALLAFGARRARRRRS